MPAALGLVFLREGTDFFLRVRMLFFAMTIRFGFSVRIAHPDCGGPEGEKHGYSLIRGRPEISPARHQ
jgi:hypothetical protein